MTHDNTSALFRPIAELTDIAPHIEFLPYPDNDFNGSIDEDHQRSLLNVKNQFTIAHLYDNTGQAFSINIPVQVISITAERTSTNFLNPYL